MGSRVDGSGSAGEAQAVVTAIRSGGPAQPELVNRYYTLCIPFYREFLGEHWHTGFYGAEAPAGPQDPMRMEAFVARSAGVRAGQHVLDVGCGIGGTACHLARLTGATVRGLTPNPAQLAIARDLARSRSPDGRVAFDLGEGGSLPYADASFDVVLFFESACHFPDREGFFAEAWRVLKPGGRLAGEDWLASLRCAPEVRELWTGRVCRTWAIPALGTVAAYADGMSRAGFDVLAAVDMRDEMELSRGFLACESARADVEHEMRLAADPIRRLIMEGLVILGEAVQREAFTIGRFLARKPHKE